MSAIEQGPVDIEIPKLDVEMEPVKRPARRSRATKRDVTARAAKTEVAQTQPPLPDRITDDEQAYLQSLIEQRTVAADTLREAQQYALVADGAFQSFGNHLTKRYGISDGGGINADGTIRRHAAGD